MKVSPFVFFLIKEGQLVLWDYKLHNQFEVTNEYLDELRQVETDKNSVNKKIFSELVENNIIVDDDDIRYSESGWEWDELAKIFHVGTQDIEEEVLAPAEHAKHYLDDCEQKFSHMPKLDYERKGDRIDLPVPNYSKLKEVKFLDTLYARHTSRNFNGAPISLEDVTILLEITFASSARDEEYLNSLNLFKIGQRKTSPSGGGLHPSEPYLLALNVEGLEKGIYHFNSNKRCLTIVQLIDDEMDLGVLLCGQYFANNLSAGIFITSVFKKQWWKYKHSRAYRVALLDVGHVSQTLLLSATALGVSTWVSGAFNDTGVSKLLGIDSINERPILFIGLGYGSGNPVDPETVNILEK